jgi:BirA family biotin operon repressor/biotin-[acetyl-CoA-carboxylase] ligase
MLGEPHIHLETVGSTNALAKERAAAGAAHGTTITADEQTAGRGRQGRAWIAPAGGALLMSVILRPLIERYRLAPLAAALAVAEVCEELAGVRAQIKWPNDVWIDGRKVGGILIEARPEHDIECSWMVVGIGLNTRLQIDQLPPELRSTAASLELDPGSDALGPLLIRLDHHLHAEPAETIAAWRSRDALRGREISWEGGEGIAAGIDDEGNLLVRGCGGGVRTLRSGEVHLSLG